MIANLGDRTTKELARGKRLDKIASICTTDTEAAVQSNAQQMFILWTKGAGDISDLQERGQKKHQEGQLCPSLLNQVLIWASANNGHEAGDCRCQTWLHQKQCGRRF